VPREHIDSETPAATAIKAALLNLAHALDEFATQRSKASAMNLNSWTGQKKQDFKKEFDRQQTAIGSLSGRLYSMGHQSPPTG
jgi:hypothetical protein